MAWLADSEKISKICLFVLTECMNVTDTQTNRQSDRRRMTTWGIDKRPRDKRPPDKRPQDKRPLRQKATGQKATEPNVKMLLSCQDVLIPLMLLHIL